MSDDYQSIFDDVDSHSLEEISARNLRWLRFPSQIEEIYFRYYDKRFRTWLRIASLIVGLVFFTAIVALWNANTVALTSREFLLLIVVFLTGAAMFALTYSSARLEVIHWGVPVVVVATMLVTGYAVHDSLIPADFFPVFMYLAMISVSLGFRVRFWPSVAILALMVVIGYWTLQVGAPPGVAILQIISALMFAIAVSYLLERDARQDFVNRLHIYTLKKEQEDITRIDILSGAFNQRYFFERAGFEFGRSVRYKRPVSLIVMEIDHLQKINKIFGRTAGDDAIIALSATCRESIRTSDILARTGGEQFALLLPETEVSAAALLAARLRSLLSRVKVPTNSQVFNFTVSMGVAALKAEDEDFETLMERSEEKLAEAKRGGRNCVVVAP